MDGDTEAAAGTAAVPADELGAIAAGMLREWFPQWRIYGQGDLWWAMRSGYAALRGPQSLICLFVSARSPKEMTSKLRRQEWLRSLTPAELESEWRRWVAAVLVEAVTR